MKDFISLWLAKSKILQKWIMIALNESVMLSEFSQTKVIHNNRNQLGSYIFLISKKIFKLKNQNYKILSTN